MRNRLFNQVCVAAAALFCGLGGASGASAAVALSFEDGTTQGVVSNANGSEPPHTVSNATATGATDGTRSLKIDYAGAYARGSIVEFNDSNPLVKQAFINGDQLLIDVTRPANGSWHRFDAAVNYRAADGSYPFLDSYNSTGGAEPGSLVWGDTDGMTKTLAFNYRNAITQPIDTTSQFYLKLFFNTNGGAPGSVYIDNVRFQPVPEPASAAVLGALAAVGALRRRRCGGC